MKIPMKFEFAFQFNIIQKKHLLFLTIEFNPPLLQLPFVKFTRRFWQNAVRQMCASKSVGKIKIILCVLGDTDLIAIKCIFTNNKS